MTVAVVSILTTAFATGEGELIRCIRRLIQADRATEWVCSCYILLCWVVYPFALYETYDSQLIISWAYLVGLPLCVELVVSVCVELLEVNIYSSTFASQVGAFQTGSDTDAEALYLCKMRTASDIDAKPLVLWKTFLLFNMVRLAILTAVGYCPWDDVISEEREPLFQTVLDLYINVRGCFGQCVSET